MPGRGPAPKTQRRNKSDVPIRGEWQPTSAIGWQHGPIPKPPDGLLAATKVAWTTWFQSWFAAHWTPDNLPDLRTCIRLYDQVERSEFVRVGELRMWEDNLGITPKGQQDRRWKRPEGVVADTEAEMDDPYRHLRVVG